MSPGWATYLYSSSLGLLLYDVLDASERVLGQIVFKAEEGTCIFNVKFCILGHGHGGSYRPYCQRSLVSEGVHLISREPNVVSVLAAG